MRKKIKSTICSWRCDERQLFKQV